MRKPRIKTAQQQLPTEMEFDLIKSNFFRVVKCDGAFGGLAPNGSIHMGVYSERNPFPRKVVHSIEQGHLGPEILERRETRKAIVRELEVDVVLDIAGAMVLRQWLDSRIEQYARLIGPLPDVPGQAVANKKNDGRNS
jgi:hypothetical protein